MRAVIVINHPYEKSYCRALLASVTKGLKQGGYEVAILDLDKDGFNPAMSAADLKAFVAHQVVDAQVISYQQQLAQADRLIFIFPIWWDLMPAATKGFVDRVLSPGFAYDHHPRGFGLVPLLKNLKSATIITTMNKPGILYSLVLGNLIRKAMLRSVFKTMGYKNLKWISFTRVKSVRQEKRVKWLADMENQFSK